MISVYSFATAVIIYNLALVLVYLLRRQKTFLPRYGTQVLLFITVLGFIRLFLPIDWPKAYVVTSATVLPKIETVLRSEPMDALAGLSVGKLLFALWVLGSCGFAIKYIIQLCLAMRRRRSYAPSDHERVERVAERLGMRYQILVSPQVSTPHTAGFFKPVIYLPALELAEAEWDYILRHEMQHIKSHDIWIKLFYGVIQIVFWWNPVSHLFMRELDSMLELRCDANLTVQLDENEKLEYLSTILNTVKQGRRQNGREAISVGLADSSQDLKQRFEMVLRFGKSANKKSRNALCLLILLLFLLSFAVIIQPAYSPPEDDLVGTFKETDGFSFILYDNGTYWLYYDEVRFGSISFDDLQIAPYNSLPIYEVETE